MLLFVRIIFCCTLLLPVYRGVAQPRMPEEANPQSQMQVRSIDITYNKTTSVVFPAVIKSVDRGSRDILAQKAKGVENILQLKAARHSFPQTNLTVITSDGIIYEFTVSYIKEPLQQVLTMENVSFPSRKGIERGTVIFQTDMTETQMENVASRIVNAKRSVRFVNESSFKIGLSLHGIYINENVIFYRFKVRNRSNINYDVDFLRFFIEDKQKVKRTASQEVVIKPIYVFGDVNKINGQSSCDVVYALEKFTIPDAKRLVFEMYEKKGGRNISLSIKNKTIVNARVVE